MNFKGSIEANPEALDDLFKAIVQQLVGDQTDLNLWLIEAIDLSPIATSPDPESTIAESGSILAGDRQLIQLHTDKVETVIQCLTGNEYFDGVILHLEISTGNGVQFATYDCFEHVFFGDEISVDLLASLKQQGFIDDYQPISA